MNSACVLLIDPEAMYWARLREQLPLREYEALCYAFEPWLPVSLSKVEIRFTADSSGQVIACGIEHATLQKLLDAHPGPVESARPQSTPRWLDRSERCVERLEFRTRAYTSPNARRVKVRLKITTCVAALLVLALLIVGIERRRISISNESSEYEAAASQIAANAIQVEPTSHARVDPLLMLTAEVRRLSLIQNTGDGPELPVDISRNFVAILAAWPQEIPVRVDALDISAHRISIRGQLRESGHFDELRAQLLDDNDAWSESSSDLTRAQQGFNFAITIEAAALEDPL